MDKIRIEPIVPSTQSVAALAAMLSEAVAGNFGMSFMHPLQPEQAQSFWRESLSRAMAGKQIVFGAWDGEPLCGSVTLVLDMPENQPHRAEIAKMMVAERARRCGIGSALLAAAEEAARAHGRSVLMLDTVKDSVASKLYVKHGWVHYGDVPGHALLPRGGLGTTAFYYKHLG